MMVEEEAPEDEAFQAELEAAIRDEMARQATAKALAAAEHKRQQQQRRIAKRRVHAK